MKIPKLFRQPTLLLLLASIAASYLVSCGSPSVGNDTTDTTQTAQPEESTQPPDTLDARKNIADGLPQMNYNGKEFVILTDDYQAKDMVVDSENGEVVNDAVFKRNQTVSERFNVQISQINFTYGETTNYAKKVILAGEDAYSLAVNHVVSMGGIVTQGLFFNWYEVPYIDFTKPWWASSTTDDLTYGGDKAVLVVGDLALSAMYKTYCYFYDKEAAEDYGIGDIYALVDSGKWTLDKVEELTKAVYKDLNGNGERDEVDYYGMTQDLRSGLNAYLWSCDNPVMKPDKDGIPQLVLKSEKVNDVFEKLYGFLYESEGVCTKRIQGADDSDGHYIARTSFADGLTLFANGYLDMAYTHFRFNESDYGILPYPKFNEAQAAYKTMAGGSHAVLSIPKTIGDAEFVGIITEALNAESYKTVIPAYYDVALKVKLTRDAESVRMLDLIMESRVFDFGYVYDNWKGMSFYPQNLLALKQSKDFESYYAANSASAIKHYDDVLAFFETMD